MSRDLAWEETFYTELADAAANHSGMEPEQVQALLELTQRRMGGIGAEQYGDSAFLDDDRDLLKEMRDEKADVIAYVVMQIQKIHHSGEDHPEMVKHLFEVALHTCIADSHARAAMMALRRGNG